MFMKLRKPLSLVLALTTIFPLVPTCVVCTSKSVLIGGRATERTACAQNLGYIELPAHSGAQRAVASPVKTTERPSPVCQWARTGSEFILPLAPGFEPTG